MTEDSKHNFFLIKNIIISLLTFEFSEAKMGIMFLWMHLTKKHENGDDEIP